MLRVKISNCAASAAAMLALAAALLSACGVADRSAVQSAAVPTPAPPIVAAAPGDLLYIRDGVKGGTERLTIIDSVSGARERDLPPGVTSPDWSTLYVAEQKDGKTTLRALDLATGQTLRATTIDGAYSLPMITPDSVMGGLSPNGRWLALTAGAGRKQTQFVVLDTAFKQPPRQVALEGHFLFDGLNNGGTSLFLTESLGDDPAAKYLRAPLRPGAWRARPKCDRRKARWQPDHERRAPDRRGLEERRLAVQPVSGPAIMGRSFMRCRSTRRNRLGWPSASICRPIARMIRRSSRAGRC